MVMQCSISQRKVFKIVEWILYIGLCIVSGWFASGVLHQFFSNKTSFSEYEEKFTQYPVLTILLYRKATEVKMTDVEIKYSTAGMAIPHQLEIGENLLHNDKYNKTEKVILDISQNINRYYRVFRIIHTTQILQDDLQRVGIQLYQNVENKAKSPLSDLVNIIITSQQNSPGFIYWKWKDGQPLLQTMNKNTWMIYNIQPQMRKFIQQSDKCQQESYYECLASQFDLMEFNDCSEQCIPNAFSNQKKTYSKPFCRNDTENEYCALKIMQGLECKKSCFNLEYFGKLAFNMAIPSENETSNFYYFYYELVNQDFAAKVYEEYFIYDAISMIGSVGGTLGMFIGFSMTGTISFLLSYLKRMNLKKRRKVSALLKREPNEMNLDDLGPKNSSPRTLCLKSHQPTIKV